MSDLYYMAGDWKAKAKTDLILRGCLHEVPANSIIAVVGAAYSSDEVMISLGPTISGWVDKDVVLDNFERVG